MKFQSELRKRGKMYPKYLIQGSCRQRSITIDNKQLLELVFVCIKFHGTDHVLYAFRMGQLKPNQKCGKINA